MVFEVFGLNSSDLCVITAYAEVQIDSTQVALTDDGLEIEFGTGDYQVSEQGTVILLFLY